MCERFYPRCGSPPGRLDGTDARRRDKQMTDRNHRMGCARAAGLRNVLVEGLILLAFVALSSSLLVR